MSQKFKVLNSCYIGLQYVRKGKVIKGKLFENGCIMIMGLVLSPEEAEDFKAF